VDGGDRGDEYNYSKPERDSSARLRLKRRRVARGVVQQTLEIVLEIEAPEALQEDRKARSHHMVVLPVTSRVTLSAGVARVDIHTTIENRALDHRLRVHCAAPFMVQEADYDGHFEVVRRPIGVPHFDASWVEQPRPEVPQRAFTAVSDGQIGLLIANRGLPEVAVLRREDATVDIAVTLLRCVGWLSRDDLPERSGLAGPGVPTPGAQMVGRWEFEYTIIPFRECERLQAYHQAYAFETSLRAVSTTVHDGTLPGNGTFIAVDAQEFVVSSIKIAEDRRGWLVRGYNLTSHPVTVTLTAAQRIASIERVNLAEERVETLSATVDHTLVLKVAAHEVATVLFGGP
jgi:mannosylglycerate hydrolase